MGVGWGSSSFSDRLSFENRGLLTELGTFSLGSVGADILHLSSQVVQDPWQISNGQFGFSRSSNSASEEVR